MRYRTKAIDPHEVEAFQVRYNSAMTQPPGWFVEAVQAGNVKIAGPDMIALINERRVPIPVYDGDWIARHADGRIECLRDEEMSRNYEPAE